MGKSPGKWIKTVLFGKKASKSSFSKGKETLKSSTERASTVSKKDPASNLDVVPFSISEPVLVSGGKENPAYEKGNAARSPNIGLILASPKQDVDAQTAKDHDLSEGSQRMRLEQAATKAQAAFRGYLVRRLFRSNDIIRLQAFIRGHLVRRQAVATLYCVQGIVKFQAVVRGQIVRRSDIGIEVRTKSTLEEKDTKHLDSGQTSTCDQAEKWLGNAFIAKLLTLSPTALPLHLQYGPEEPNSASDWLLRWTASRIWEPKSKPKKVLPAKQRRVETGKARAKRSGGRSHSGVIENVSNHNMSESEKQKRIPRRISNHSVHSVQGNPQNEIEKAKSNLKKISNSTRDITSEREVDKEKQNQDDSKQPNILTLDLSEHSTDTQSDQLRVNLEANLPKTADQEACVELPITEICDHPISNSGEQPKMIREENEDILIVDKDFKGDLADDENHQVSKRRASLPANHDYQDAGLPSVIIADNNDQTSNENHKVSKRRASLPAKHDEQDISLPSETKVPSYMATTESAKAKARGQVSPRFGQDAYEKNGLTRRYSLPSSTNSKPTSSPRVQSLVQASGKGGIKIDRSLSSSRDGKMMQAEWRR